METLEKRKTNNMLLPTETKNTKLQKRRHYAESYKKKVVKNVLELRKLGNGQISKYLQKEGLYYSVVWKWEKKYSQNFTNKNRVNKKNKNRKLFKSEKKGTDRAMEMVLEFIRSSLA